jgi:hypothetical protein
MGRCRVHGPAIEPGVPLLVEGTEGVDEALNGKNTLPAFEHTARRLRAINRCVFVG